MFRRGWSFLPCPKNSAELHVRLKDCKMHSNRCTEKGRRSIPIGLVSINERTVFATLKVHKIENFFDSDFGICLISLLVMSKY